MPYRVSSPGIKKRTFKSKKRAKEWRLWVKFTGNAKTLVHMYKVKSLKSKYRKR